MSTIFKKRRLYKAKFPRKKHYQLKIRNEMKPVLMILGIIFGPFIFGILVFNFIALPLWVGKHEEVEVPDVCGKKLEQAEKELNKVDLVSNVQAQEFSKLPKGIVISQNPLPGRRVRPGKEIQLSVSRGKEKLKVPWLEGMPLEQARNILLNSDLRVGEIIYEYSNTVESGYVIKTEPAVDMYVSRKAKIDIFVSQGISEFSLPKFTGNTLKNAQEEAYRLGLQLDIRYIGTPSPSGIIISQSPSPGTVAKNGDCVEVVVGLPNR